MIIAKRYEKCDEQIWNRFNSESKNYLFMFDRSYMDYHSDRFFDHSLLFYDDDELVSILPMNEKDGMLQSHGGLTYGGLILGRNAKQHTVNECFEALIVYCCANNLSNVYYKQIPYIYHKQPSEEDRYALFINHASIDKIEAATVINLSDPLKMTKGRKAQVSRAKREGVHIDELKDKQSYLQFIELENAVLSQHHATKAVHSGEELWLLHSRFPESICLYGAIKDDVLIAGTVLFVYDQVVHTQYMAANDLSREIGALDLTINTVIEKYKSSKKWLDFGISTENNGKYLNQGLISQKESFGGRTVVYQTWLLTI